MFCESGGGIMFCESGGGIVCFVNLGGIVCFVSLMWNCVFCESGVEVCVL